LCGVTVDAVSGDCIAYIGSRVNLHTKGIVCDAVTWPDSVVTCAIVKPDPEHRVGNRLVSINAHADKVIASDVVTAVGVTAALNRARVAADHVLFDGVVVGAARSTRIITPRCFSTRMDNRIAALAAERAAMPSRG